MIQYEFDVDGLKITEQKNGDDIEFNIILDHQERYLPAFQQLRDHFNADQIVTDVMFYAHSDHDYQVIVRGDYYVDFLLVLFKFKLIRKLVWD